MRNFTNFFSAIIAIIGFGAAINAQCPGGQAAITIDVTTDSWGYECYWEVTPTGSACGTGTLGAFGNAGVVGCFGGGGGFAAAADPGAYPNLTTTNEDLSCLTIGSCFDIHYVDDWGDGGASFQVYVDGIATDFYTGSGTGNIFTFCVTAPASFDAAMSNPDEEYTIVPLSHVTPLGVNGLISNVGSGTITNANMTVNVYDGSMATVYTGTSNTIASIASGASAGVTATGYTPTLVDVYTVELISNITELDGDLFNDTVYSTYAVTDSIYARDNGTLANLLGVGTGATAVIGQNYDLLASDTMTSVSFFVAPGAAGLGDSVSVSIYDVAGGTPTTLIGESQVYMLTTADTVTAGAFITLNVTDLSSAPLILSTGTYYVAANEYNTVDNMALGFTSDIFTPNSAWISVNGGAFAASETFGFPGAYIVRPNFGTYACTPTSSTVTETACTSYTWAQNGSTYTSTGMYTDVIPNASGCDSTITLDLTIGSLDNSTATAGAVISANAGGMIYQWIDCGNGNAILSGENGQSYTATANGDYAVIISDGSCVDTSACVSILTFGLGENPLEQGVDIYPNPSNGNFTIAVADLTANELTIVITETSGKVIFTQTFENIADHLEIPVQLKGLNAGIYFVEISADAMQTTRRVVVTK